MTTKNKCNSLKYIAKVDALPFFAGMHYLEVPEKIVRALGGKFRLRLLCTMANSAPFPCGLMALGKGKGYIMLNKKRMQALQLKPGDRVPVILTRDKSKYGMPLAPELKEVLKQDPEGKKRFDALTPGKQRNIIAYVNSVKDTDLRIDRSLLLIENLKTLPLGGERFMEMLKKRPAL